jgi:hypothetical protein
MLGLRAGRSARRLLAVQLAVDLLDPLAPARPAAAVSVPPAAATTEGCAHQAEEQEQEEEREQEPEEPEAEPARAVPVAERHGACHGGDLRGDRLRDADLVADQTDRPDDQESEDRACEVHLVRLLSLPDQRRAGL